MGLLAWGQKAEISRHRAPGRRTGLVGEVRERVRGTRQKELRHEGGETQKGNRRKEKPDRAEEMSEERINNHNDDKQA